jgi:hypothetical protein
MCESCSNTKNKCAANDMGNCKGDIIEITFTWIVKSVTEYISEGTKTYLRFNFCKEHYEEICKKNQEKQPIIYGEDIEEAYYFLLSYLDENVPWDINDCCGLYDSHLKCSGPKQTHWILWHYMEREKYGNCHYHTTLPLTFCDGHYEKLLQNNNGVFPLAYGWDQWDAIDSITSYFEEINHSSNLKLENGIYRYEATMNSIQLPVIFE